MSDSTPAEEALDPDTGVMREPHRDDLFQT